MMIYAYKILTTRNGEITGVFQHLYTSAINLYLDKDSLKKEILESLEKDSNVEYVFQYLDFAFKFPNEITKEIYEQSYREHENFVNSIEGKQFFLKRDYKVLIDNIKYVIQTSKESDLLNSQEFLDFMDELNKLSIDPDVEDSK